eukprot:4066757-Prorocentrum_lima.AAC.1
MYLIRRGFQGLGCLGKEDGRVDGGRVDEGKMKGGWGRSSRRGILPFAEKRKKAVSYTHLTLPTICSV